MWRLIKIYGNTIIKAIYIYIWFMLTQVLEAVQVEPDLNTAMNLKVYQLLYV